MLQPWIGRAASRVKLSASVEEARIYQARFNWRDIERIKKNFDIQIVLKGIGTAEDAKIALECGADCVYVSNHGGRQLDEGVGSIDVLLEHGLHQLVLKPPSGVGRDPQPPAQLDVGDALLALAKQMHGAEPHPHRQLGALQNGAGDQRCLVPASPALEQLTALDLGILCRCAPWALEALRPAPGEPRLAAGLLVRIALLERIVREALLVLYAVARHRLTLKIVVFSG